MKWLSIILLIAGSFFMLAVYHGKKETSSAYTETKEMIVLRKVVHDLLLSSGDSVSRVLPVKQVSDQEFQLFPEKPLSIKPDSFVNIVNKTIREGNLVRNFTASIVKCQGKEIVYGFAASPAAGESVVTCLGTKLPEDCYYLSFIFSTEQKNVLNNSAFYWSLAVITSLALFFVWRNRKLKKSGNPAAPETTGQQNSIQENTLQIGKYLFNPEQQYLEMDAEKTVLTIIECKVLSILANTPNTMIERDTIQNEVWGNEGVIVTRSLDMFISKLRKKLSGDPGIKIINVHGKGYKLCLQ
jgi:Transcriptional regulatory protein, C terminal